jgi:phosphotransferase system enzyme I (PtsI)
MGPFVRMGFASESDRRPGCDEAGALRAAFEIAARDLATLAARAGADAAECLEFQLALLEDETLVAPAFERIAEGGAADAVWRRIMDDLISEYGTNPNEYVQTRGSDVADLRDRVLKALDGDNAAVEPPAGAIVAAVDLPPSRFLEIDWSRGGGIALSRGSAMSHTAILARAYGVPMVVQTGVLPHATRALIDADLGFVELDPSDEDLRDFGAYLSGVGATPGVDLSARLSYRGDGIRLLLNIEGLESLSHPSARFADGIGLMRTEFLFRGRTEAPDEEAQFEAYSAVLRWAGDRPVTIRTVDAGGDKTMPGFSETGETNPALGLRGLRLSLRRLDAFTTQLRALARAAVRGPLKVMFPFVTLPSEFDAARALFHRVVEALKSEGREARMPELGMMVEIPAAALIIRRFDAAFFSIGGNDLTQFVLACDRANGTVSQLYDPMHPAVLELVRRVVEDASARGRSVSLCGDAAADPAQTLELLHCGVREFSMSANSLAAVKGAMLEISEARLG